MPSSPLDFIQTNTNFVDWLVGKFQKAEGRALTNLLASRKVIKTLFGTVEQYDENRIKTFFIFLQRSKMKSSLNLGLQVNPSMRRLPQYRADLTAILLIAHDLLLGAVDEDTRDLFHPSSSASSSSTPFAKEIHAKCSVLAAALTVVGCPIQVIETM